MPQDEVKALSDYEIVNDESEDLDMQISSILASAGIGAEAKPSVCF